MRLVDQKTLVVLAIVLVAGSALYLIELYSKERLGVETHTGIGKEGRSPTVRIGVVSPTQESDPEYRFLARLAESEINAYCNESGIDYSFEFVFGCAGGMAQEAQDETRRLHGLGANLSVGYAWSSQLCASYNYFGEEHGMTVISTGSSSWISCCRKEDRAFRICPYEGELARPLAQVVYSRGVTDLIVFKREDSWGRHMVDKISRELEELGGRILIMVNYTGSTGSESGSNSPEFRPYLAQAESALSSVDEDARACAGVLALSFSEIGMILKEAEEYPLLMDIPWFMSDLSSNFSIQEEGSLDEASKVTLMSLKVNIPENPVYRRVNEAYEAMFGEELGFYDANIYDACWLMALSAMEANTTDGVAVSQVLPAVALGYRGATGNFTLDEYGDRTNLDFDVLGFFDLDGEIRRLRCGLYISSEDRIVWDEELVNLPGC